MKPNQNRFKQTTLVVLLLCISVPTQIFGLETYIDLDNTLGQSEYIMGSRLVPLASFFSTSLDVNGLLNEYSRVYLTMDQTTVIPHSEYSTRGTEVGMAFRNLHIPDNQLFATIYAYLNNYEDTYSYYNSSGVGLYGKWKHYFGPGHLVSAGYDIVMKRFTEVEEASYTEQELQVAYNKSFSTRTSLQLQNTVSSQKFRPQSTISTSGRHVVVTEEQIESNFLNGVNLRISQSLGHRVGLTLWLGSQLLLNERQDSLALQDGLDNPFIDKYRWNGDMVAERVILRLNENNRFTLSHAYRTRNFVNVPVYAFDFDQMDYLIIDDDWVSLGFDREDRRHSINMEWMRTWDLSRSKWLSSFQMLFNAGYNSNKSNDALYDYEGMNYSISLKLFN